MADSDPRNSKPIDSIPSSSSPPSSHKPPNGTAPETGYLGRTKYPNPPETSNPDVSTLREQWKYATRQYSRWYAHAWGTAIAAGLSFFALGWIIKGHNPLESFITETSRKGDGVVGSDQEDKKTS